MHSINPRDYYHELDEKALNALKAIPGFTSVSKIYMKNFTETQLHGVYMASKIRLGPEQLPEIYNLLPPICDILGITEPEFYLEMDPNPNAYTTGDSTTFITVTSGLIECMNEEELKAVIAHECGHIACHHALYTTMAMLILNGSDEFFNLGVLALPLKLALSYWQRCSELSADRAAAIYMQNSQAVEDTMIRLSGGSKNVIKGINKNLFMKQADDYSTLVESSGLNKALQYLAVMTMSHPFATVRASEIHEWCESQKFKDIVKYLNTNEIDNEGKKCPSCGVAVENSWKFCKNCGNSLK